MHFKKNAKFYIKVVEVRECLSVSDFSSVFPRLCLTSMADSGKRNIPIKLGDFSVIDSEFSNIRERFDAEMRKMEDEMTKFRSELMNRESNFFKTSTRCVPYLFD